MEVKGGTTGRSRLERTRIVWKCIKRLEAGITGEED